MLLKKIFCVLVIGLFLTAVAAEDMTIKQQIEQTKEMIKQEQESRDQMQSELSEKDKQVAELKEKLKKLEDQIGK